MGYLGRREPFRPILSGLLFHDHEYEGPLTLSYPARVHFAVPAADRDALNAVLEADLGPGNFSVPLVDSNSVITHYGCSGVFHSWQYDLLYRKVVTEFDGAQGAGTWAAFLQVLGTSDDLPP